MNAALQMAVDFTPHQAEDIILLRRLFYCQLGRLARHRKALLSQIAASEVDTYHASEKLSNLADMGMQLQENGKEEYRTWMELGICLMRGVSYSSGYTESLLNRSTISYTSLASATYARPQTHMQLNM